VPRTGRFAVKAHHHCIITSACAYVAFRLDDFATLALFFSWEG